MHTELYNTLYIYILYYKYIFAIKHFGPNTGLAPVEWLFKFNFVHQTAKQ